jgi:hypothetical protein
MTATTPAPCKPTWDIATSRIRPGTRRSRQTGSRASGETDCRCASRGLSSACALVSICGSRRGFSASPSKRRTVKHSKAAGVWEPTASPCYPRTVRLWRPHRRDRFKFAATNARSDQKGSIRVVIFKRLPKCSGGFSECNYACGNARHRAC